MTPTEKIDAALDAILAPIESSIWHIKQCSMISELDRMREAMKKIMSDSYINGSNDAHEAMKGK